MVEHLILKAADEMNVGSVNCVICVYDVTAAAAPFFLRVGLSEGASVFVVTHVVCSTFRCQRLHVMQA